MFRKYILSVFPMVAAGLLATASILPAASVIGTAYTMTNAADGNAVMIYNRMDDGTLAMVGTTATGGNGTGAPLGSQGALAMGDNGHVLLVVNAGSNSVSAFRVSPGGALTLTGTFPSGGTTPNSIAVYGRLVYVLNSGTPNNITGFLMGTGPVLAQIYNSTRTLSADSTTPPQVGISPDGTYVVVTEKDTNLIDLFRLGTNGYPGALVTQPSNGMTPFGFAFGRNGRIFVSEAFGGAVDASAASSYVVNGNATLTTVTASAPTHQTAACWMVLNPGGRVAYVTNTQSASVSGYAIGADGSLNLLNPDGRTGLTPEGSEPVDAAVAPDAPYLYVLTNAVPGVTSLRTESNGQLTSIGTVSAPKAASGLAIR